MERRMNDTYISVNGLGKSFGDKRVLEGIDASVRPGDVIGLLGLNGAGKTTLLEVLLGLSPPSTGRTQLFGARATDAPAAAKARIGFVPQRDELIGLLTGRQYLDLIATFYPDWDAAFAEKLIAEWNIEARRSILAYSVGQRQKLAIIAALAHKPDLLVLDEPVASLDPLARRQFLQQIIEASADERRAVVFSSHIVSDVERLANVIWVLKEGKLLWQGDLDTLKESVIRVHARAAAAQAVRARLGRVVAERSINGSGHKFVALRVPGEDWSTLERQLGADASIERLGLEDIFLELHS
jgi:ABC-2 type transport system ATP-binding protein